MPDNPNCDGGFCYHTAGQVRVYPLGSKPEHDNLILCQSCWAHENRYRGERGHEMQRPEDWPQLNWESAKVYGDDVAKAEDYAIADAASGSPD